jgi:predicted lipoprotein with Yx(FWY)xxD motif
VTSTTTITTTSTEVTTATAKSVASPQYTVNFAYKSGIGFYLTNATGYTLYFRSTDTPGSGNTTCTTSTCEKNWPVFYTSTLKLPPGLNATDFNTIAAYNSTKIVTYDGYPLFYWISDTTPGSTTGQGVGNFYVCTVPTPKA